MPRSSSTPEPRRAESATSQDRTRPSVESLASLVIRSIIVLFLLLTSLLLALVAWYSLRSYLKVDPLIGRERVWLQYGEFRTPYAYVNLPKASYGAPGHSYDISLELTVPTSQQNLVMGNFMATIGLLNKDSESILNNSRPSILTLEHPLEALPRLPLPFFGSKHRAPPSQSLSIPLLESVALNRNGWSSNSVETIYVEVGRKDAHPEWLSNAVHGAAVSTHSTNLLNTKIGGELQVYESWLQIRVKLSGLRALIRSHPYLSFLFFFPTFLVTELLAALAVYAYFVFRPDHDERDRVDATVKREGRDEVKEDSEQDDGIENVLEQESDTAAEAEDLTTSEPPSNVAESETEDAEEKWESDRRRARRMREAGPGGKGMSEIVGELETETETETEAETGVSEEEGSEEWAAIETGPRAGEVDEKEPDEDIATVGGSETSRATRSTFGPSIAGTTASTTHTTATTTSTQSLRERQGRLAAESE